MSERTTHAGSHPTLLTEEQVRQFICEGYVVTSGLIPHEIIQEMRAVLWKALGMVEDDPSTWPDQRILVPHEVNPLMAPCRTSAFEAVAVQLVGPHFVRGGGVSPVLNFPRPGEQRFQPIGFHIVASANPPSGRSSGSWCPSST
jgi:hypothetical protein